MGLCLESHLMSASMGSKRKKRTFDVAFLTGQAEEEDEISRGHEEREQVKLKHEDSPEDETTFLPLNLRGPRFDTISEDFQLSRLESTTIRRIIDLNQSESVKLKENLQSLTPPTNSSYSGTYPSSSPSSWTSGKGSTSSDHQIIYHPKAKGGSLGFPESYLGMYNPFQGLGLPRPPFPAPPPPQQPHPGPPGGPPVPPGSLLPPSLTSLTLPAQNVCAKCNIGFRMTSDLVYHMRSQHKRDSDPMKKKREEKLKCPVCGETFRERHHLTRHMTAHIDREEEVAEFRKGVGGVQGVGGVSEDPNV